MAGDGGNDAPVERSRGGYLSHRFDADAKFATTVRRTVIRQDAQVAGDIALVIAETESSGSYNGKRVKLRGTEMAVLRQADDQWPIAHVHWSSRKPKP
jgi:ketosteroid isomerase-like protein